MDQKQEPKSAQEVEVPHMAKAAENITTSHVKTPKKKLKTRREGDKVSVFE
jgi:hypothetical protein